MTGVPRCIETNIIDMPYTKKRHTYFFTKPFRCILMYPHSQKQTTTRDILMDTDYL